MPQLIVNAAEWLRNAVNNTLIVLVIQSII